MNLSLFTLVSLAGVVIKWLTTSLEDGKITLNEGLNLIIEVGTRLDLPIDQDVKTYLTNIEPPSDINDHYLDEIEQPVIKPKIPLQE